MWMPTCSSHDTDEGFALFCQLWASPCFHHVEPIWVNAYGIAHSFPKWYPITVPICPNWLAHAFPKWYPYGSLHIFFPYGIAHSFSKRNPMTVPNCPYGLVHAFPSYDTHMGYCLFCPHFLNVTLTLHTLPYKDYPRFSHVIPIWATPYSAHNGIAHLLPPFIKILMNKKPLITVYQ